MQRSVLGQSCYIGSDNQSTCRYQHQCILLFSISLFLPTSTVEIRMCQKLMTLLERIVDNYKNDLRLSFLSGEIEVGLIFLYKLFGSLIFLNLYLSQTRPFFTEDIQEKFRERFEGVLRPIDVDLRDAKAPLPLIIVVEAVMWHLGFYKASELAVRN